MTTDWQTWAALGVVAVTAALLLRGAWRRRGGHGDCGCTGAQAGQELKQLKRQMRR